MKKTDSRANSQYKMLKSLLGASGIREHNKVIVSGRKLVPELLLSHGAHASLIIVSDPKDVEKISFHRNIDVLWLKKELFDEIDEAGTHFPILILSRPNLEKTDLKTPPRGIEVVLSFSNPLNMGAALRSCEAFEVSKITLLKECAHPYLPKVIRASSGSALRVPIELGPSITELTQKEAQYLTALDRTGESIAKANLTTHTRLFIGEEGRGLPKCFSYAKTLSIPMKENMDSLNAVAATSIALYAIRNR